jgi:hypothetical protein
MTSVQDISGGNNNSNNGNNGNNGNLIPSLIPVPSSSYFKLGSLTRRHSVIGCIGYEFANPQKEKGEEKEKEEENICSICLEKQESGQKNNLATTPCGHTFCLSCLISHLKYNTSCPLCRAPVEQNVKRVLKPLSYTEGIGLLDRQLDGLRIYEDVEQFVQNAMEVSSQSNTDGQNVEDVIGDIMTMVTNFGFNLLYNSTLHTNGSEEHMDPEWIIQMYDDDDDDDDDSTINESDDSDDSDSDSESGTDDSDSESDSDEEESKNKRIVLPEVPESMLE